MQIITTTSMATLHGSFRMSEIADLTKSKQEEEALSASSNCFTFAVSWAISLSLSIPFVVKIRCDISKVASRLAMEDIKSSEEVNGWMSFRALEGPKI